MCVYIYSTRISQHGHRKATCELSARERHVKTRNLMSAAMYALLENYGISNSIISNLWRE
jgi:hypothetical protein